jgi:hypothetical protein
MRHLCGVVVTFVACGVDSPPAIEPHIDNSKADGQARLEFRDRSRLDMEEPSDLVRVGDELFAVSDRHSKI